MPGPQRSANSTKVLARAIAADGRTPIGKVVTGSSVLRSSSASEISLAARAPRLRTC